MARFAVGGFLHETNTFAPGKTTFNNFTTSTSDDTGLRIGKEILAFKDHEMNVGPSGFIRKAEALGHQVVPLVWTSAQPSGVVADETFEQIMDMLIKALRENGPYEGVYLDLHGAMVTESLEDPETEIGRRVRQVIGDIPLVAELDLHGNITAECVEVFSALDGYRTYPHVDIYQSGERCAVLLNYLTQNPPLKKAFRKVPYLIAPSMASTLTEPFKTINQTLEQLEQNGTIVSGVIMHGFLPSDIAQVGPAVWTYATTQEKADDGVEVLERALLDHEKDLRATMLSPDEAVQRAIEISRNAAKPVVLADVQDNPGGGSSSDTVWILESLVRHNAPDSALGLMYDPQAAEQAFAAGEGARITLDLGGKGLPGHRPFHGTFTVEKLAEGNFPLTGPMTRGIIGNLGKMAQLRIGNVRVVVVSGRTQALDQAYYTRVGIVPSEMKIVVVKSTNHYRAAFMPIASEIIVVDAPGAIIEDPAKIPYQRIRPGVRR